jgi:hypothetical protein
MSDEVKTGKKINSSAERWLNRLLWGLVLAALAGTGLIVSAPIILEKEIKGWIEQSGLGSASIGYLHFNPFSGTMALRDVVLNHQGTETLSMKVLQLRLEWLPLWQKRVAVQKLSIGGMQTTLREGEDGVPMLGGLRLAAGEDTGEAWGLGVDALALHSCNIRIQTQNLDQSLQIDSFQLRGLASWQKDIPASLGFSGKVLGAAIKLEGTVQPFSDHPTAHFDLLLSGLDSSLISRTISAQGVDFAGGLSANLTLDAVIREGRIESRQQGELLIESAKLDIQGNRIQQKRMAWKGDIQLRHEPESGLYFDASGGLSLTGAAAVMNGESALSFASLLLPGLQVTFSPEGTRLHHGGNIQLEQFEANLNHDRFSGDSLAWDGELRLTSGAQSTSLELEGKLQAPNPSLQFDEGRSELAIESLQWQGRLTSSSAADGLTLRSEGKLQAAGQRLSLNNRSLESRISNLSWQGSATTQSPVNGEQPAVVRIEGEFSTGAGQVDARDTGYRLLEWAGLQTAPLRGSDEGAHHLTSALLRDLRLGQKLGPGPVSPSAAGAPMLAAREVRIEDIRLHNEEVSTGIVSPEGLQLRLSRDADGQWNLARIAADLKPLLAGEDRDESGGRMRFTLGDLVLAGEGEILFDDQKTEPAYSEKLLLERFRLSAIDSEIPELPSPFEGLIRIGEHSRIQLSGDYNLFAADPAGRLELEISALEMPPFSSYVEGALGYSMDSGQVDAKGNLGLAEGTIDGVINLELHQLAVSPLESEARARLDTQMSVPLDSALDLLRDEHNSIRLELPIAGNLDNPDFDLRDAINQATGKAVKKGAMTYLTATLQPFGALLMIVSAAGDAASAVRLDPVFFEPGKTLWQEQTEQYLQKVSNVLQERPELRIRVCGLATESDRNAMEILVQQELERRRAESESRDAADEKPEGDAATPPVSITDKELLALAQARSDRVKGHLVEQHGIDPGRLVACKPARDEDREARGRVDLMI